ncbi:MULTISPECIES: LacI family DNA-binding transcriptional regulator [Shewanella]|uniref:LacI family DNA-binding transcriptional regulator n=2 Tax=Shewanellaceae TaxID=267890 RepID=UPI000C451228|nr:MULTISPECIES: LacI family DNA-binding transcriptional regulator [Shewanella]NCQ44586.1 LacI family transcriptional regulator [Shewanella frigidimarina]NCO72249.1 LacI family transcriptional regulator [Shewanella vesiculosa]NCP35929.1 LacI family transcriptional regulator [Shewanella vesiculosa]NCP68684.1 LacI family transcriptional regulator [Shewanella vesiculosa]NCP73593.1 LacI family transcriptional regulator [Shewanella vesiculosa]|tara:strand:- start:2408 stop:3421 length:1014 start_codon:yes stop_codon:yes gene_type:complete
MKVTINDVAKYAGVSIKTVSRVTNKEPSVKQATIDKVNQAITALNYQPNLAARNLASTSSYVIGFIYDNPNAYYVIDMQNGILSACKDRGFELLIHPCNAKSETICDELTTMVKHARLAGLVLTPPMSEDPNILAALDQIGANYVKIIAGEKIINSNGLTVLVNDQRGAVEITQHLIDLGHKHIAFLSGDLQHESTKERLLGFKKALKNNSLTLNTDWVLEGEYSFESGLAGANKLITMAKRPTAIVACNDEIAAGALFAARLAGLDIPTELSIVGFEDSPFSRQTWPKLTTVHQPNIEIAQIATQLLIDKRKNQTTETFRCFTPTPVIRNSTTSPT